MQHHKYSLTELDNMIPWEREIYIKLLMQHLKEEKSRQDFRTQKNQASLKEDRKTLLGYNHKGK